MKVFENLITNSAVFHGFTYNGDLYGYLRPTQIFKSLLLVDKLQRWTGGGGEVI